MAIGTPTALTAGAFAGANNATISLTLATGDFLIVSYLFNSTRTVSTITWNGIALNQDTSTGGATRLAISSLYIASGATANLVITLSGTATGAVQPLKVTGMSPGTAFDKTSTHQDLTSTTPTSNATATTTQANELLIGAIDRIGGAAIGGSWSNSFTDLATKADGTTNATNVGYRIVSAAGAYTAAKTGVTSGNYQSTIVTYIGTSQPLAASVTSSASVTAPLKGAGALRSTVTSSSAITASLKGSGALASSLTAIASISATLRGSAALHAALTSSSSIAATLRGSGALAATLVSFSSITATLRGSGALSAGLTSTSIVTGALVGAGALVASISSASTISASLTASGSLAAALVSASAISATLKGAGALLASISSTSDIVATLSGDSSGNLAAALTSTAAITATIEGSGAMTAFLTSRARLIAVPSPFQGYFELRRVNVAMKKAPRIPVRGS